MVLRLVLLKEGSPVRVNIIGNSTVAQAFVFNENVLEDNRPAVDPETGEGIDENIPTVVIHGNVDPETAQAIVAALERMIDSSGRINTDAADEEVQKILEEAGVSIEVTEDGDVQFTVPEREEQEEPSASGGSRRPVRRITLTPATSTVITFLGGRLAGDVTLEGNYNADGLKTVVRLEDEQGEPVNFDKLFASFELWTRVGDEGEFQGPFQMAVYGPGEGYSVRAGVPQVTKVEAKVNKEATSGVYVIVTEVKSGEQVLATGRLTLDVRQHPPYEFEIEGLADEYIVGEGLDDDPNDEDFNGKAWVEIRIVPDVEGDDFVPYPGNVRVAPVGVEGLQLWAKATDGRWYDINRTGWGPAAGFPIVSDATTKVYVIFTKPFEGTVTLKLIDVDGDYGAVDNVIIQQEVQVKAVEPTSD